MGKIICRKCNTDWTKLASFLRMQNIVVCTNCDEPLPELMDRATWEKGDLRKGEDR